jgi:histidyl-tRNA synthetase
MRRYRRVADTARSAAECFGYQEMATPIFEFSEVFKRTLGDTSDIVTKEMYTFTDRGGETITLRPEGTASVARALISGGLVQHLPLKYFYSGPMFRYERPQKGRMRQFHQTGIELLGVKEPLGDVEVIATGAEFLRRIGAWDRSQLEINTLGDTESRQNYRKVLVDYLSGHKEHLSEDSVARLERNPLRILDSKDAGDRVVIADAPRLQDSLDSESRAFFDKWSRRRPALPALSPAPPAQPARRPARRAGGGRGTGRGASCSRLGSGAPRPPDRARSARNRGRSLAPRPAGWAAAGAPRPSGQWAARRRGRRR